MTEEMVVAGDNGIDMGDLMSPEEMAQYKALQQKMKAQKAAVGPAKSKLFNTLTEKFAGLILQAKKDIVTISTGEAYLDGNIYTVTFGVDEEKEVIDTKKLTLDIIDANQAPIESLMGIADSLKVNGEFNGKKLFWQIRKRQKADKE